MSRYIGNYIRATSTEPTQSSTQGIWSLSDQLAYKQRDQWPPERDPYYNLTTLHLPGNVVGSGYQATTLPVAFNSDSSTNKFLVTPVGDVRASSFSPYGDIWSNYLTGSSTYLSVPAAADMSLTGDFTIEFWMNSTVFSRDPYDRRIVRCLADPMAGTGNGFDFALNGNPSGGTGQLIFGSNSGISLVTPFTVCDGAWKHIAVARSGSTVKLFVNGSVIATATNATSITDGATYPLYIGWFGGTGQGYYNGYLSNLRIVRSAVYTNNFNPPTSNLTEIPNTSLLTCNSNRFIDRSSSSKTITVVGSPRVSQYSPFVTTDTTNGSGYFDGNADYLTAGDQTAFEFGAGDYTVECWWYPTTTADQNIIGKWDAGGSEWILQWRSLGYYRWASGGNVISDTSSITLRLNAWNHISVTKTSGSLRIYSNGSQINTTASEGTISATTAQLTIGTSQLNSSPGYVTGYISDVRIIKGTAIAPPASAPTAPLQAVSGTSLLTLQTRHQAQNSGFLDSSPNNFVITRSGNVSQGSFSPFSPSGWSNYFLGRLGTNLNLSSNSGLAVGSGQFCVEAWVYVIPQTLTSQGYGYGTIISQGNNNTNNQWWLGIADTTGVINWGYTGSGTTVSSSYPVLKNTWSHIAVTRDASNVERIFLNGMLVNSRTNTTNYSSVNGYQVHIGSSYDSNYPSAYGISSYANPFSGYINNLRIVVGSIPTQYQTSTTTLGSQIFTQPSSNLTAVSGTILLTCQSNSFKDNSVNNWTINKTGSDLISVQPLSPFAPTSTYLPQTHGGSGYFDGTTDYLTTPASNIFDYAAGQAFTFECWFYPTTSAGMTITQGGANTLSVDITPGSSGSINYGKSGVANIISVTTSIAVGSWHYLVIARNSSNQSRMWLNGVSIGSSSSDSYSFNNAVQYLGSNANPGSYFVGYLACIRNAKGTTFYDPTSASSITVPIAPPTPLTGTSLLLNFTNAGIVDATGRNVVETVGNAHVSTAQSKFGSGSKYFDGTGDYLSIVDKPIFMLGNSPFTIEAWIYPTALPGSNNTSYIVAQLDDAQALTNQSFQFQIYNNSGTLQLYASLVSGSTGYNLGGNFAFVTNTWYHVAFVRISGGVTRLFVNGTQVGADGAANVSINDSNTNLTVGCRLNVGAAQGAFSGYIDDVRITNGIARYSTNFNNNLPSRPFAIG